MTDTRHGGVSLKATGPDVHHLTATLTCPARHTLHVATYNAADPEPRHWIDQHTHCPQHWTRRPVALAARLAVLLALLLWVTWNTAGDLATSSRLTDFFALLVIFTVLVVPWGAVFGATRRRLWPRLTVRRDERTEP